jgi:hypothetical protein
LPLAAACVSAGAAAASATSGNGLSVGSAMKVAITFAGADWSTKLLDSYLLLLGADTNKTLHSDAV